MVTLWNKSVAVLRDQGFAGVGHCNRCCCAWSHIAKCKYVMLAGDRVAMFGDSSKRCHHL